jgi:CRP-like cAMP-binding protein
LETSQIDIAAASLARKLTQFIELSPDELSCLDRLQVHNRTFDRRVNLRSEGESGQPCFVLQDGWACCFKLLLNGRRQIINFAIPGDFLGLRSVLFRVSDHSVASITPVRVSSFSGHELFEIIDRFPRVAAAILWALSCEEAIVVEHLVNIGRRNALERVAHFLIEFGERLQVIGLATDQGYECPFTQEDLADALGLSAIHINRILRQLREQQLLTLSHGSLQIHDLPGLAAVAQFSDEYLDQDHRPS